MLVARRRKMEILPKTNDILSNLSGNTFSVLHSNEPVGEVSKEIDKWGILKLYATYIRTCFSLNK